LTSACESSKSWGQNLLGPIQLARKTNLAIIAQG
jgi:hypothetical protein